MTNTPNYPHRKAAHTFIIAAAGIALFMLIASSFSSCTTQKNGCKIHQGYIGY